MTTNTIYKFFADYVYKHTGITYKEADYYRLDSRFNTLIGHFNLKDVNELFNLYKTEITKEMHTFLIDLCTNNETYFFCDMKPFQAFAKEGLEYVMNEIKPPLGVNIWSCACSTGQELLTIYMSADYFGKFDLNKISLDASDISTEVLDKAKEGIYSGLDVQCGLLTLLFLKYFEKDEENWKVKRGVFPTPNFFELNLLTENFPVNKYHIVFCRNVLIYQEMENKKKILEKIYDAMVLGGLLFFGVGESMIGMQLDFESIQLGKAYCYQKKK